MVDRYEFDFTDAEQSSEVIFSIEQIQLIGDRIGAALAEGNSRRGIDDFYSSVARLLRRARKKLANLPAL